MCVSGFGLADEFVRKQYFFDHCLFLRGQPRKPKGKGNKRAFPKQTAPPWWTNEEFVVITTFFHLRNITASKIKTLNTPAAHSKMTDNIFGLKHCFSGPFYHFFKKQTLSEPGAFYLDVKWSDHTFILLFLECMVIQSFFSSGRGCTFNKYM